MAYWTLDGVYGVMPKARVVALVDDEDAQDITPTPANAAYNRVVAAGAKADALIDTYLRGHYSVPLTTVPDVVRSVSAVLTVCELYLRSDVEELPQKLRDARDATMRLLEHIRDDKIRLFDEQQADSTIQVNKTADDQMFSDTILNQY